jgi:general stress protein 26
VNELQEVLMAAAVAKSVADKVKAKFESGEVLAAFATRTEDGRPWVRYLMVRADDDLNLWTTSALDTRKVHHIRAHPEVHLTLGVKDLETAESYVQVEGRAEVLVDEESRRHMWHDSLSAYFSGPEDPGYCVIKVTPYRIEFQTMTVAPPEVWEA